MVTSASSFSCAKPADDACPSISTSPASRLHPEMDSPT